MKNLLHSSSLTTTDFSGLLARGSRCLDFLPSPFSGLLVPRQPFLSIAVVDQPPSLELLVFTVGIFFDRPSLSALLQSVLSGHVLLRYLEGGNLLTVIASSLPSVSQLHSELWMSVKCPFLEGAESIEIVALLLLENITNCLLKEVELDHSTNSILLSAKYNVGQWFNPEADQCVIDLKCDAACCLRKCMVTAAQPHVLNNDSICDLSDVLPLVELVASRMSWHWTDTRLVPQLLSMLDSCVVENFSAAIVAFLGQIGRLGVVVGGYEDREVENLRCYLFSFWCRNYSMKAGPFLQLATGSALIGVLPFEVI